MAYNQLVCNPARTILKRQGNTVFSHDHGAMALAELKARQGLLGRLLTDVVMPGMNGKGFFHLTRKLVPDS